MCVCVCCKEVAGLRRDEKGRNSLLVEWEDKPAGDCYYNYDLGPARGLQLSKSCHAYLIHAKEYVLCMCKL